VVAGGNYGWPGCWGVGQGEGCDGTRSAIALVDPHVSADGLVIYTQAAFPAEYQGNAFVAMWGSYVNPARPRVVRVTLSMVGEEVIGRSEDFVTELGRPLDLAVDPAGALYIADYETESVYRVSYAK
jgi:glucose/arabinose dehydrogenase